MLFLHLATGIVVCFLWHLGTGLEPGKQSSIKFIYVAYLFAPATTLCFTTPFGAQRLGPWFGYLLLLFAAALPIAIHVPRGL